MATSPHAAAVEHDPLAQRFQVLVDGHRATLDYRLAGCRVLMLSVRVPVPLEGRGIAARLTAAAVGWAEAGGMSVGSQCSYVDAWLRRRGSPGGSAPQ